MSRFKIFNGPMPTTAALVGVTTGTSLKTMLQLKPFNTMKIVAWGLSFSGFAAAAPIRCELIETGSVFATVTAHVDADVMKMASVEDAAASVAGLTLGTTATGYTSSSEGTITASRLFDAIQVPPSGQIAIQFPLGREPKMIIGNATRIRVHAPAAVDCICWIEVEP